MRRSRWKVPFVSFYFYRPSFLSANSFNTRIRESLITKAFLDKTLRVYNGQTLKSFYVRGDMVGKRLGEFSVSKTLGSDIGQTKKGVKQRLRSRKK